MAAERFTINTAKSQLVKIIICYAVQYRAATPAFYTIASYSKGEHTMQQALTPEQAAIILQCHPETVRRMARTGKLRGNRTGSGWRFTERDLLTYLDACRPSPPHPEPTP